MGWFLDFALYALACFGAFCLIALGFMRWASRFKDDHEQDEHE